MDPSAIKLFFAAPESFPDVRVDDLAISWLTACIWATSVTKAAAHMSDRPAQPARYRTCGTA
ncbi:MAG TPA: hypothetical protein VHX68_04910, partial [Planctomycetaceae bacterium]|nr:hypothetical protein [Planctomycetaceae bacterium]